MSYFGYWPEFADGKIMRFLIEMPGTIELAIHYIDSEKKKSAHIGLRFYCVSEVLLRELGVENVIDSLQIVGEAPHSIAIDACYGIYGTFLCKDVEVLHVNACLR